MNLRSFFIAMIFVSVLFSKEFHLYTEQMPPYNLMQNGEVKGVATLFLKQVMQEYGTFIDTKKIRLLTWSRAYEEALKDEQSILYSVAKTPQREELFQWVGPIDTMQIGLIAKKSRAIKIDSPKDLNNYKIGTMPRTATEDILKELGVMDENLDRFSHIESQLKKLEANRVDMVAFSYQAMEYLLHKLGFNQEEYELVYTLKKVDLYYAFHKKSNEQMIERLNGIIQVFNNDKNTSFETLKKNFSFIK